MGIKEFSRPSWDEYFMIMAIVAATRSTCHNVKAGCVIALDKRVIGTGYNGAPPGVTNCFELGSCRKKLMGFDYKSSLNSGKCIGVHAEMNALANLSRVSHKGAIVYCTIFPCSSCAKTLLAYSISKIVYKREYDSSEFDTAKRLFEEAGVIIEKLDPSPERVMEVLFNHPDTFFDTFTEKEKEEILKKEEI